MEFQEYKKAIEDNFSGLKINSIVKAGEGWDNFAFFVNDEYVFRFSRGYNDYIIKQLKAEICLLPKLQNYFSLAIPNFEFIGKHNGQTFVGYKKIHGVPFTKDILRGIDQKNRKQAIKDLAFFVTRLHELPFDIVRKCVAWQETSREIYTKRHKRLAELKGRVPEHLIDYLTSQFDYFFADLVNFEQDSVLIHGDISPDHIIFNTKTLKVEGIIDFGDIAISDPDLDLRWLVDPSDFEEGFLDEFLRFYKHPNIPILKKKLNFFYNVGPLINLTHGLDNNDQKKFDDGIKQLERNAKS